LTSRQVGDANWINTEGKGTDDWASYILALDANADRILASSFDVTCEGGWLPTDDVTVVPRSAIAAIDVLKVQP
jgi:hypothetical protein